MTWLTAIVILACFGVGKYYEYCTDKIDAPGEQLAEAVLEKENIIEDFSADKKKVKALEDSKNQENK